MVIAIHLAMWMLYTNDRYYVIMLITFIHNNVNEYGMTKTLVDNEMYVGMIECCSKCNV